MSERNKSFSTLTFFLVIAVSLFIACENELDPIDRDSGVYGIYGALDLNKQINYIRVKNLNAELTAEATDTIDATVTLENLETGVIDTLESTRLDFDGIYLHNFIVNEPVNPDTPYRVTAERSDGKKTSIETLTPTMPVPNAEPQNQDCNTQVVVTYEPTNGSTVVLRVGIPYENELGPIYWGAPVELNDTSNQQNRIVYTFTPQILLNLVPGSVTNGQDLDCTDLHDDDFLISFTHYAPGFYEKIENVPFDILASTDRFGAYYRDTLSVTIDISQGSSNKITVRI